jgi:hypothetical protein
VSICDSPFGPLTTRRRAVFGISADRFERLTAHLADHFSPVFLQLFGFLLAPLVNEDLPNVSAKMAVVTGSFVGREHCQQKRDISGRIFHIGAVVKNEWVREPLADSVRHCYQSPVTVKQSRVIPGDYPNVEIAERPFRHGFVG